MNVYLKNDYPQRRYKLWRYGNQKNFFKQEEKIFI